MKIILSNKVEIELTKEKAQAFRDELRFACHTVSVLPVIEEVLALMED